MIKYPLPTGYLFVDEYERGKLETLSIGDYGKKANVKADFLGFTKPIEGVENQHCMPLSEKWVITLSTQYGCPMKCTFCLPPHEKILMDDNTYKKISEVKIGDKVKANINPKENKNNVKQYATVTVTTATVTGEFKRKYKGKIYSIITESGKRIRCTGEHPIAVKGNFHNTYIDAKDVTTDDYVISIDKDCFYDKVSSIFNYDYEGVVYNIETSEHNYYAGNILTHNCDVPNLKFNGNASFDDLKKQLYSALSLFPDVHYTERLNIHYARMGDPIFNSNVFNFSEWLIKNKRIFQDETGIRAEVIHPVLTTSLPRKFKHLQERIYHWAVIKNDLYNGQAGLQFSINSTNEEQRQQMYNNMVLTLEEFSEIVKVLPPPLGRKYCLNFAYSTDFEIDAEKLVKLFSPDDFMVKITPIHNNNSCRKNDIKTIGGYDSYIPYTKPEEDLKKVGFDVLVFVPSIDEEDGLVTCGNAILGGSEMKVNIDKNDIKIIGI